jgi:pimeloyl-ACP methyl ester carboxylesterase
MAGASRDVITRQVSTSRGRLHVTDHPGAEPAPVFDRYLGSALAADLASLFPGAGLHLVDGASRGPQWDQPKAVSELIR